MRGLLCELIAEEARTVARTLLALACVGLLLSGGWAQQLIWLGQLPGGLESEALGVSADGAVVHSFAGGAVRVWQ